MPVDIQSDEVHPSNDEVVSIEGTIELKESDVQHTDEIGKELGKNFWNPLDLSLKKLFVYHSNFVKLCVWAHYIF